jgi:hypothetical protein
MIPRVLKARLKEAAAQLPVVTLTGPAAFWKDYVVPRGVPRK